MQVYLNPTPQGFWGRDTLPGLSTYIDHSLTPLPNCFMAQITHYTLPGLSTSSLTHSLTSYNCFRLAQTIATFQWWCRCIWTPPLKVSGTETLCQGLSTYIDHSLTHLLLITVSDWHRSQLHSSDDAGVSEPHPSRFLGQRHSPRTVHLHRSLTHSLTSYNCFRLAQIIATFQWWCRCIWTPPLKVSGTETLSQGCPPT